MGLLYIENTKSSILENKLYDVAIYTLRHLFSENLENLDNINLKIELCNDLYIKDKIFGDVVELEEHRYYIRLDKYQSDIVVTLIHELVHCWQYYNKLIDRTSNIKYSERSWEKQAYELEKQIHENYIASMYA